MKKKDGKWNRTHKTEANKNKMFSTIENNLNAGVSQKEDERKYIENFYNNNKHSTDRMRGGRVRCRAAIQHLVVSLLQFHIEDSRLVAYILVELLHVYGYF